MEQIAETTRNAIRDQAAAFAAEVPSDTVILVIVEPPEEPGKMFISVVPGIFQGFGIRRNRYVNFIEIRESEVSDCKVTMKALDRAAYAKALDIKIVAELFGEHGSKLSEEMRTVLRAKKGQSALITMTPRFFLNVELVPSGARKPRIVGVEFAGVETVTVGGRS
jgi:hypothetical protein